MESLLGRLGLRSVGVAGAPPRLQLTGDVNATTRHAYREAKRQLARDRVDRGRPDGTPHVDLGTPEFPRRHFVPVARWQCVALAVGIGPFYSAIGLERFGVRVGVGEARVDAQLGRIERVPSGYTGERLAPSVPADREDREPIPLRGWSYTAAIERA